MLRGPKMLQPLRRRDFALLWVGQSVSLIGDGIFTVTLAWQTLLISSSPGALAAVLLARSIPQVALLILGGAITDRLSRRALLVTSDLVRGLAVGTIALLVALGNIELWHLLTLGALFGTANAFFFPAYTAITPEVLPAELLPAGNALNTTSRLLGANFAGPAIGGAIVAAAGTQWGFAADAISFGIALGAALAMRAVPAPQAAGSRLLGEVRDGFAFTRSQPWLWVTLLAAGVGNLSFSSLAVMLPILIKEDLHRGAADLGLVSACLGVGGLIAAVLVGLAGLPRRRIAAMYIAWFCAALALAAIGVAPSILLVGAAMAACGFTLEFGTVVWMTLMQELVPRRMLGRVSALDWLLSLGLTPLAFAVAGPLGGAVGAGPVLLGGGLLAAMVNLVGVTRPGVLDPDRRSSDDPRPDEADRVDS